MTRHALLIASAALLAGAGGGGVALAVPGGAIGVLPQGPYICEVPGEGSDPLTFAGRHVPEADFTVIADSSYQAGGGRGVYLLTGARVAMTSGPLAGHSFVRVRDGYLRAAPGGDAAMRCVRSLQAPLVTASEGTRCAKGKAAALAQSGGSPELKATC